MIWRLALGPGRADSAQGAKRLPCALVLEVFVMLDALGMLAERP